MYKLNSNSIQRLTDKAFIPMDEGNTDYQEYLKWLAQGNTPEPADLPDPNLAILAQIDSIERATLMNRGAREGWIEVIRGKAAEQGVTDDAVISSVNPFFKKLVEVDAQVRALRSQLV